ncbi:MAG: hypothetical protein KF716_14075 [Anaerolineae bacterium]|nr:hypothetical protein [Anaerolineae bacterium]
MKRFIHFIRRCLTCCVALVFGIMAIGRLPTLLLHPFQIAGFSYTDNYLLFHNIAPEKTSTQDALYFLEDYLSPLPSSQIPAQRDFETEYVGGYISFFNGGNSIVDSVGIDTFKVGAPTLGDIILLAGTPCFVLVSDKHSGMVRVTLKYEHAMIELSISKMGSFSPTHPIEKMSLLHVTNTCHVGANQSRTWHGFASVESYR